MIKIGLIGFGNIGKKRFNALKKINKSKYQLNFICDTKKINLNNKKIKIYNDWKKAIHYNDVDLLFICTPTKITEKILNTVIGKYHLLVEKPISTNFKSIKKFTDISLKKNKIIKTGYNLRFDKGLNYVKKLIEKEYLGKIYHVKISYVNGTTLTNTNAVGSLLDMGAHSINLINWYFDLKIKDKYSIFQKNEFLNKRKIDNGFISFISKNIMIFIHHGFCNWKNNFDLEILGKKAFIHVSSLPKWGTQKVVLGKRKYPSGIPKLFTKYFKYDLSWEQELNFLINNLNKKYKYLEINSEELNTQKIIRKIFPNV